MKKSLVEVTEEMKEKHPLMVRHAISPNDCAEILLQQLDPSERDYYQNIALENGYELWQLLCSVLRLSCDRGDGTAGIMDPRWGKEGKDKKNDGVCIICTGPFVATRLGQQVCSGDCGTKFEMKKMLDAYNAKGLKCVFCGESFIAQVLNQLYDSDDCLVAHQAEMKKKGIQKGDDETKESSGKKLTPLKINRK